MDLRPASRGDLPAILSIMDAARRTMARTGNPTQWQNGYPGPALLERDIALGAGHVLLLNGTPTAYFALLRGADPAYAHIDGAWKNDLPYGAIHRLASDGRAHGAATVCIDWCAAACGNLRADTHADNAIMRHLLKKNGFVYCGIVYMVDDGTPRRAYQRTADPA